MVSRILADFTASVTELQKDPMGTAASGNGAAVAILNRNALAFYCVPADEYHAMVDRLDDIELNVLVEARRGGPFVEVGLAEL
jgi:antitoxin StbD